MNKLNRGKEITSVKDCKLTGVGLRVICEDGDVGTLTWETGLGYCIEWDKVKHRVHTQPDLVADLIKNNIKIYEYIEPQPEVKPKTKTRKTISKQLIIDLMVEMYRQGRTDTALYPSTALDDKSIEIRAERIFKENLNGR